MRRLAFTLVVVFIMPAEAQTILPFRESTFSNGSGGAGLKYPNSVFVVGNLAYVTSQVSHSLDIIDISVPSAPVFISKMVTGGRVHLAAANAVFVSGNYAYVTALEEALEIIDVSDPASPSHVSSITNHVAGAELRIPATIFVQNGFAYVGGAGFGIIDVSNPAIPTPRGSLTTLFNIRSLVAVGNYVYAVQSSSNRLIVIDVTDKYDPKVVGSLAHGDGGALLNSPNAIAVSGTKAFIASSGSSALEIVDITNPAAPAHLGSLSFFAAGSSLSNPVSVQVAGNYAYVTGTSFVSSGILEVVDISNSAMPVRVGTLTPSQFTYPVSIAVSGNIACMIGQQSNSMHVVDISNPTTPQQVGAIVKGSGGASLGNIFDIEWAGDALYVATGTGIQVVDVHNPSRPVPLAFLADGSGGAKLATCTSIEISGSFAYATSAEDNALEVLDISNPAQIHHVATLSDGEGGADLSAPRDVSIAGNYAYVAVWNSHSIEIIDISNPAAPVHAGNITDGDEGTMFARPMCIKISGNYAYVVGWEDNSIEILDISDPVQPHHAATISNAMNGVSLNGPGSIAIKDGYAFVADNGNGELEIFNVSNPTNPSHVASLPLFPSIPAFSSSHAVSRVGNYCLVADYSRNAMDIVDVSNPAAPVNTVFNDGNFFNPSTVTAAGNNAFVGNTGSVAVVALFTPPQVTVTEATGITSTSFDARWLTVNYAPFSPPVTYGIDVSQDNFATFVPGFQNLQTSGTIGVHGLQPATEYQYRVRATNANGTGPVSETMTVKTASVAPAILPADPVGQFSLVAHWGTVSDVTNYLFTIEKTAGPTLILDQLVFGDSLEVTGLEPGTTYSYSVKSGSSWANSLASSPFTVTTIPPDPVTTEATEIAPTSFRANWLSAKSATGYFLDVSQDDFTTFVVQDLALSTTTYLIDSLIHTAAPYQYRVRALNGSGTSGNSNVTSTLISSVEHLTKEMKLFPNPTTGVLNYELPGASLTGGIRLTVTDVTGRQRWSGWSATDQFVDVSGLSAGLYFFTADLGSHSLREKFIKK